MIFAIDILGRDFLLETLKGYPFEFPFFEHYFA
ncbi:hypothetical protein N186_08565 [Thermofilum adornatum]|uniref:Uncharacterized protein n=1 Tax=Thermofilum adornatum TaxID=1365176 RepID=S5Z9P8_9CREN|nr:hypothetical protein N186_08565 [Thermofilum adornatum]